MGVVGCALGCVWGVSGCGEGWGGEERARGETYSRRRVLASTAVWDDTRRPNTGFV